MPNVIDSLEGSAEHPATDASRCRRDV